jgi:hypothetical protein
MEKEKALMRPAAERKIVEAGATAMRLATEGVCGQA